MREIKFRAWDNKAKEWLLGYDHETLGGFSLFGECMLLGEWSHILNKFILQQRDRVPEDLVVMQYTGLKDKNGKEIYEGDIIVGEFDSKNLMGFVMYTEVLLRFEVKISYETTMLTRFNRPEVIGNIYENPELLKK